MMTQPFFWWLILIAIVLGSFSPLLPIYVADKIKPLDYVNDSQGFGWLCVWMLGVTLPVGALAITGWVVYGIVLLIKGA